MTDMPGDVRQQDVDRAQRLARALLVVDVAALALLLWCALSGFWGG